jgi:hypothetical protein
MGGPGAATARFDAGPGDVEERQHELLALPAAYPGRDRSAPPPREPRAAARLSAEDGRGRLDRNDEPYRAAGRLGPVARAHARRAPGRPLPHLRAEDLHHVRRARPCREHRPPGAGANAGCPGRHQGNLPVRRAEAPSQRGRHAGAPQQPEMRLDRAQARHPREPDRGHGLRPGARLSRRRGEPRPRVHVHHDECGALRGRPGRRRHRGAGVPARPRFRARASAGTRSHPGRRCRTHHPPSRRAPHADAHEGAGRGDARAGVHHRGCHGPREKEPRPRGAQASSGVRRPHDPGRQGVVHRDRYRGGVARGPGARRHGLCRGDRRCAIPARRADHHDLRGDDRHPGDGPRRAQDRAGGRRDGQGLARFGKRRRSRDCAVGQSGREGAEPAPRPRAPGGRRRRQLHRCDERSARELRRRSSLPQADGHRRRRLADGRSTGTPAMRLS